jgi:CDGSH-type Zn-finger protein
MATIKVRQNGSLLVEGEDVTLIDWNGNEYQLAKRPFALCRCGHSTKIGFQAAEAALGPEAKDRPAGDAPTS